MYALEHQFSLTVFQASSLVPSLIPVLSDCVPVCASPLLLLHHLVHSQVKVGKDAGAMVDLEEGMRRKNLEGEKKEGKSGLKR